jgi:predicted small metal-binding protein
MTRKFIDCREFPSEANCSIAIVADSESELLDAAVQHAVAVHHHMDSPELRAGLRQLVRDGTPPETFAPIPGADAQSGELRSC